MSKITHEIKQGLACNSINKPHSPVARAVCLSVHPGKMILFPLKHWYNTRYHGRYKFARAMFGFDLFLIGVAVTLAVIAVYAHFFLPGRFEDKISFDATIAPREVITGASSTLVLRFTNGTKEELRNAQITLTTPKHFLQQEASSFELGTIPVGEMAVIHVKGVMFGDVGGEQMFKSKLTFVHGEKKDVFGEKTDSQTFSPTKSALTLSLELPERVIANQPIDGVIRYHNDSEVNFPNVSILPHWPEGFTFLSSDVKQKNGRFELSAVEVGKTGEIRFNGFLGVVEDEITFVFDPSFTFGEERYTQNILTHTAPIVPLPLTLQHSVEKQRVRPGDEAVITITVQNISDFAVTDVVVGVESDSPFVKQNFVKPEIARVEPGDSKTVSVRVKLRSTIQQSETSIYEHLVFTTRPTATYTMDDGTSARVTSKGSTLSTPLTTPLVLESFARYTAASGDQIGRGPMPPIVGKETTYWIFWHVDGTTNELSDVRIEGTLPEGVRFTGKQTVSQNGGVTYDSDTKKVVWTSDSIAPTLAPTNKTVGIGFEVGITPTNADNAKFLILMNDIHLSAIDQWTGAIISAQRKEVLGK